MRRRRFLLCAGTGALLAARAGRAAPARPKVLVVGGGYGGAAAAKYVRLWGGEGIDIILVEPQPDFVSCPLSNLVLGGSRQIAELTLGLDSLSHRYAVRIVRDSATAIDAAGRTVRLAGGDTLAYDRLILSPGVDFIWDELAGMDADGARDKVLHAWKAGPQTTALRARLEAMPDGGTYLLAVPPAPYRCPPGPYERACQVAHYFSRHKPNSRVLVLDANPNVVSKGALFRKVWQERYGSIVEYRPNFRTVEVDAAAQAVVSELGDRQQASVLNVVPPQRAAAIAVQSGLASANQRWCEVDFLTFESKQAPYVHILGDAILTAPLMPKSAHMANQHAKVCAAAVVDLLSERAPEQRPVLTNTCYSFVSDREVIHVASVHAYDAQRKTLLAVSGSGGLSEAASELEGRYAESWARNIWADTLA